MKRAGFLFFVALVASQTLEELLVQKENHLRQLAVAALDLYANALDCELSCDCFVSLCRSDLSQVICFQYGN